jgi:hypothetical protein
MAGSSRGHYIDRLAVLTDMTTEAAPSGGTARFVRHGDDAHQWPFEEFEKLLVQPQSAPAAYPEPF